MNTIIRKQAFLFCALALFACPFLLQLAHADEEVKITLKKPQISKCGTFQVLQEIEIKEYEDGWRNYTPTRLLLQPTALGASVGSEIPLKVVLQDHLKKNAFCQVVQWESIRGEDDSRFILLKQCSYFEATEETWNELRFEHILYRMDESGDVDKRWLCRPFETPKINELLLED
jgi:hypothetical protein